MKYLHTMIRVTDLDASLHFYCDLLGLQEIRRKDVPAGKFTLVFLATEPGEPEIELTYNWESDEVLGGGRNFGHLAYRVDDIYALCQHLQDNGHSTSAPRRPHGLRAQPGQHLDRAATKRRRPTQPGTLGINAQPGRVVA